MENKVEKCSVLIPAALRKASGSRGRGYKLELLD